MNKSMYGYIHRAAATRLLDNKGYRCLSLFSRCKNAFIIHGYNTRNER